MEVRPEWPLGLDAASPRSLTRLGRKLLGSLGREIAIVSARELAIIFFSLILVTLSLLKLLLGRLEHIGAIIVGALDLYTWLFLPPEKGCGHKGLVGRLIPGPQLVAVYIAALHHMLFAEARAPPTTFTLEPVGESFSLFLVQIIAAMRRMPARVRILTMGVNIVVRAIKPTLGIGWREPLLAFLGGMTGILCGLAMNSHQNVLQTRLDIAKSKRFADSSLNHMIKGQCGGASALLSELSRLPSSSGTTIMTSLARELLAQIVSMLDEAAKWCAVGHPIPIRRYASAAARVLCHHRQLFVKLESGRYRTSMRTVRLRDVLTGIAGPRFEVNAPEILIIDNRIVRLLVLEVVSNAMKHSRRGSPIKVAADFIGIEPVHGFGSNGLLHVRITNVNRPGMAHLTSKECALAFTPDFKIDHMAPGHDVSDRVGLSSVKLAAESVGGTAWLSADVDVTTVHLQIPAARPDDTCNRRGKGGARCRYELTAPAPSLLDGGGAGTTSASTPQYMSSLPGANNQVVQVAHKPPAQHSRAAGIGPQASVHSARIITSGSRKEKPYAPLKPIDSLINESTLQAVLGRPPICIGIDDVPALRHMQETLFRVMQADAERSGSIGATLAEVEAYVELVMGRRNMSLEPDRLTQADIAVIDEIIDVQAHGGMRVKGCDLARELRRNKFMGVVCILNGSTGEVVQRLARVPGVDFVFEKGAELTEISSTLLAAHQQLLAERRAAGIARALHRLGGF